LRSLRAALRGPPPPLACWCRSRWPPSRCAVLESQWTSCGICSSSLLWWLSGWCCSTCWPAGAEPAVTAAAPPCVVARALGCRRRRRAQQSTKIADAPLHQSREAHHSARPAFAEAHASQHLATQPVPISATNHPSTRPRVPDGSHHGALLSTQFFRGQQCAEAPLGRRRRDPAAAWQYSRQSRAGRYLTVEPSWLPSAACAAHSNTGRRPTVPWSPCPRPHVQSVRPSSVRRPARVQCPASGTCPASARLVSARPISSAVSASSVQCERPASVSTLSAPVSSWSAWVRQAATRLETGRPGNYLTVEACLKTGLTA
jgi:hypothetical protein